MAELDWAEAFNRYDEAKRQVKAKEEALWEARKAACEAFEVLKETLKKEDGDG